jgi:hypothetical protein
VGCRRTTFAAVEDTLDREEAASTGTEPLPQADGEDTAHRPEGGTGRQLTEGDMDLHLVGTGSEADERHRLIKMTDGTIMAMIGGLRQREGMVLLPTAPDSRPAHRPLQDTEMLRLGVMMRIIRRLSSPELSPLRHCLASTMGFPLAKL